MKAWIDLPPVDSSGDWLAKHVDCLLLEINKSWVLRVYGAVPPSRLYVRLEIARGARDVLSVRSVAGGSRRDPASGIRRERIAHAEKRETKARI